MDKCSRVRTAADKPDNEKGVERGDSIRLMNPRFPGAPSFVAEMGGTVPVSDVLALAFDCRCAAI